MRQASLSAEDEVLRASGYDAFASALRASGCGLCALSAGRTAIVVDRGNPGARVLIVGEAPGDHEDRSGRAFVGRAGRLLDKLLDEAGFSTDRDALIANVVKCRPPANRPPRPEEAAACLPYLRRQIQLVGPRFLVLLGATAVKHLLPSLKTVGLSSRAGTLFEDPSYPGMRLCVLFHPAYILRDPRKTPLMREHVRRFVDAWRAA